MATKDQVLERLNLIIDEPEESELLFDFKKYARQVSKVLLDKDTPTPFVIAVHGSWGSGKTSLILEIQKQVQKGITEKSLTTWKELRFDAWEYEKTDVISALLHQISAKYQDRKGKIEAFTKSVGLFLTDVALQKGVGLGLEQAKQHFQEFIDDIPTIKTKLGDLTQDGRLIVFVDDLDRCHIDNVLDMLEAIKMFLTAENVLFVMAVDMKKIERAWKLRYNTDDASIEGLEHIEKIFPLKLSLPPKNMEDVQKYVKAMCSSLSETEQNIIVYCCPPNPRKIKRIINLAYFVLKNLDDDENFDYKVSLVLIWCIITSLYPRLADLIKEEPHTLIQIALPIVLFDNKQEIMRQRDNFAKVLSQNQNFGVGASIAMSPNWAHRNTITGLLHMIDEEPDAMKVFEIFGSHNNLKKIVPANGSKEFEERVNALYNNILPSFQDVIYNSSLIGN